MQKHSIRIRNVEQNNLKGFDVDIPLGKMTVVTGPSGSGKSSLAFQTVYAEGQRRYVETFSPYMRQFMDRMAKPKVEEIQNIPPTIALEQNNAVRTKRSTVGSISEIDDFLKLLFPRFAKGKNPENGQEVRPQGASIVAQELIRNFVGQDIFILFLVEKSEGRDLAGVIENFRAKGFVRGVMNGECFRLEEISEWNGDFFVVLDRLKVAKSSAARIGEAVELGYELGKNAVQIAQISENREVKIIKTYRNDWFPLLPPKAALFSFYSPQGACPVCRGFGEKLVIDYEKLIDSTQPLRSKFVSGLFPLPIMEGLHAEMLKAAKAKNFDLDAPLANLNREVYDWLVNGDSGLWLGLQEVFDWMNARRHKPVYMFIVSRYRKPILCPSCLGKRLRPEALCFEISGKTLPDLEEMPVKNLRHWLNQNLPKVDAPGLDSGTKQVLEALEARIGYLDKVGLGYLTLNRPTKTLSGGELQRVHLTTCLGAALANTLFVLDEPTIGLHPRDTENLVELMHELRDKGNTLLVVEHEDKVMRLADHIIDIGPKAGKFGGELLFSGTRESFFQQTELLTAQYLTQKKSVSIPQKRRKWKEKSGRKISFYQANCHNILDLDVQIPLGRFVCLTGVSGSGKSTLAHEIIYRQILKNLGKDEELILSRVGKIEGLEEITHVESIDQTPVARSSRSTPVTYIGIFDDMRALLAKMPEVKAKGYSAGYFSFNAGGGSCPRCKGAGVETVEMQFLSDLTLKCPECRGRRYSPEALEIFVFGKTIADILELSIDEAVLYFEQFSKGVVRERVLHGLGVLSEVGLGYLSLGQTLSTLSGGENQRLKIAKYLVESQKYPQESGILFIFDEPTTGLHFEDIQRLMGVFHRLVDRGISLLVIEHNLDVIKNADYVIDMGPEAGVDGGKIVAKGTPEEIMQSPNSLTGRYLKSYLERKTEELPNSLVKLTRDSGQIELRGAREHNLKNISLDIPREKFVVITGLSGSGKSTLAFDILFGEGQRRFLDAMSTYARQFAEQISKPDYDSLSGLPATVSIEQRVSRGGGKSTVATVTEIWQFLRLMYAKLGTQFCPKCQIAVHSQSSDQIFDEIHQILNSTKRVRILAMYVRRKKGFHYDVCALAQKNGLDTLLINGEWVKVSEFPELSRYKAHDIDILVEDFSQEEWAKIPEEERKKRLQRALSLGKGAVRLIDGKGKSQLFSTRMSCPQCQESFEDLDPSQFSYNSPQGWCPKCHGYGYTIAKTKKKDASSSALEGELLVEQQMEKAEGESQTICSECGGSRLNRAARSVQIQGFSIDQIGKKSVKDSLKQMRQFHFVGNEQEIARDLTTEIQRRLEFLEHVGLGYIQLNRSATTLSGGEAQRIRLAAQLGSNLRGVLYVLDEPTIGLHPSDNAKLLDTLELLKNQGNSLVVVEHDEETMRRADHIIDLGPGAGRFGGNIVAEGNLNELMQNKQSVTGRAMLELESQKVVRKCRKTSGEFIEIKGCRANNLKEIDVKIPKRALTVITGVSGSGKSSLMRHVILPAAQEVISKAKGNEKTWDLATGFENFKAVYEVDQSPIGKTPRSTPSTYVGVWDEIRKLFATLPTAKMKGYTNSRFSFNNEEGRCPACKGNGWIKLEMNFMAPTWVLCEDCQGKRFSPATLDVEWNGKNISDVLAMSIDEAADVFSGLSKIYLPLKILSETGLGYLSLGQTSSSLSGGEAQRLKLVTELTKGDQRARTNLLKGRAASECLYLIEEPSIGLHFEDVKKLIDVLQRLVDAGNTVIVIEHNTQIMKEADYIIDIGPGAGEDGGQIVASGTPQQIAKSKVSKTAPFLKE